MPGIHGKSPVAHMAMSGIVAHEIIVIFRYADHSVRRVTMEEGTKRVFSVEMGVAALDPVTGYPTPTWWETTYLPAAT